MILALLILLSANAPGQRSPANTDRVVLMDETVRVPPSEWRAIDFALRQRPAIIDCRFAVVRGYSGVRLALVPRQSIEQFRAGEGHKVILSTGYRRAGEFRYASSAGDYSLIIDNRLEGRGAADVRLKVSLLFGGQPHVPVLELSARRKLTVILVTAIAFTLIVVFAVRRLRRAMGGRQPADAL